MQDMESKAVNEAVVIAWLDQEEPALVEVMTIGVVEFAPVAAQSEDVPLKTHDTESRLVTPEGTTGVEFQDWALAPLE